MRVSMLVRWCAALAVVAVSAACSDTTTAPPTSAARPRLSLGSTEQWLLDNGGLPRDGRGKKNKTDSSWTQTFTFDPTQPYTLKAGDHVVTFPANAICDPATSGYDPSLWDAPCSPLQSQITITATWSNKLGHAFIDFQPALRFVPTNDPSQYVTINMKDGWALDTTYHYPIYWLRPSDSLWVDESINDSSETSVEDLNGNRVQRRLKHFSGYLIGAGEVCDAFASVDCSSVLSFSGYLVAF